MELHLYDFDGTLFRSPLPPDSWPGGEAWWSDSISLSDPCVPVRPGGAWWNESVVSAAKKSIAAPDVLAVMCTGRSSRSFARFRVPELLRQKGLDFDAVFLKPNIASPTEPFKKAVILQVLARNPDITVVHLYEDRPNHLTAYQNLVEGLGATCVPHLIRAVEVQCDAAAQRLARRWLQAKAAASG
jgi:hypothetical protein